MMNICGYPWPMARKSGSAWAYWNWPDIWDGTVQDKTLGTQKIGLGPLCPQSYFLRFPCSECYAILALRIARMRFISLYTIM